MPARVAAALTIVLGLASLTGWALGIPALTSIIPGGVQMKANTAAALVLSAVALLILADGAKPAMQRVAQVLGGVVLGLGAATVAEYWTGRSLDIDEFLFKDAVGAYNIFRGRMSPLTAAGFIALATALIALPNRRLYALARLGAGFTLLLSAGVWLGYFWNADDLTTDRWLPPVALNTAAGFALLGGGILLSRDGSRLKIGRRIGSLSGIEIKILTGFVVAFAVLLIGCSYTYRTVVQFTESVEWVAHTQEVRAAVASIYGSLAGAEVALRDYLLTRDETYRNANLRLRTDVARNLDDLQRLTTDNPTQRANVAALRPIVAGRLESMAATLKAFADFGLPAARAVIAVSRRTNATQSVKERTDILDAEEMRLLRERETATAHVRSTTLISLLATLALAFGLFVTLFRNVHREMRARREAEDAVRASERYSRSVLEEVRESNRFLDSLIDNLPLMVVIKDAAELRVVRHNAAFAQVLGFSHDRLQGRSSEELFTADEARNITATDREALELGGLVEVAEQSIVTAHLGRRTFHTMKVPIRDRDGTPRYLMAISTDITARKLSEEAIRELNTALEAKAGQLESSNRELESFSYSVSHDLRAPLRAIDGFALMIEEDYSAGMDSEVRRYLAVIRENSRRMGALIDDLLSFSRLGRLPLVTHEVNVEALVREVVEETLNGRRLQPDAGHEVPPHIDIGDLPPVTGDRGLLRQVWVNLISNAIKYSSKSAAPRIEVNGRRSGAEILYTISDNGVGFDMDYVDKLFGVFQRLHRADEFSGTGVGLAIVHRVVTRHGGRIWAQGRIDAGATFTFALPVGEP